jgi:hypothetical protein
MPREEGVRFSMEQRNLAIRALDEAEERTSRYYCIPPHQWQDLPYDLLTRQDTEWEPLPAAVLAQVQRLEKISPRRAGSFDFYRIQLNDPSILTAAERENLYAYFYHFLVYILTHEMVHLVRLGKIIGHERDLPVCPETEESRVHRISRQILSNVGYGAFHPILEKFCLPVPIARNS